MGVVKTKSNQDEKHLKAGKMHFAFVLPFALVAAVSGAVVPSVGSQPAVTSSQFHSQDEAGNFAFGYANPTSQREESGNVETGVVRSRTPTPGEGLSTMLLTTLASGQLFESCDLDCYHHWRPDNSPNISWIKKAIFTTSIMV